MSPLTCPCCGSTSFHQVAILWAGLIAEWQLSSIEAEYIERQQGFTCDRCGSTMRSMALASAILGVVGSGLPLKRFTRRHPRLAVLEMNEAGQLTQMLSQVRGHVLASYPEVRLESLPYADGSFDLVVHSDTLEHVEDPDQALRETLRVLKPGGATCFTVPLVVGRLTASRQGKPNSFHGSEKSPAYLVHNEFGSDVWSRVLEAGFRSCELVALEYPAGIAIVGRAAPRQRGRRR